MVIRSFTYFSFANNIPQSEFFSKILLTKIIFRTKNKNLQSILAVFLVIVVVIILAIGLSFGTEEDNDGEINKGNQTSSTVSPTTTLTSTTNSTSTVTVSNTNVTRTVNSTTTVPSVTGNSTAFNSTVI